MKNVLIIGNGKLANHLEEVLSKDNFVAKLVRNNRYYLNALNFDLSKISLEKFKSNEIDFNRLNKSMISASDKFDIIINTMAITDINECKVNEKYTYFINSEFPERFYNIIAKNNQKTGKNTKFIHISSLTVNRGKSIYAKSKRFTEKKLEEVKKRIYKDNYSNDLLIIRTAWLFDEKPDNKFTSNVLRMIIEHPNLDEIKGSNQYGQPTHYRFLAECIKYLIDNPKILYKDVYKIDITGFERFTRNNLLYNLLEVIDKDIQLKNYQIDSKEYPDEISYINHSYRILKQLIDIDFCKYIIYNETMPLYRHCVKQIYKELKGEI